MQYYSYCKVQSYCNYIVNVKAFSAGFLAWFYKTLLPYDLQGREYPYVTFIATFWLDNILIVLLTL